MQACAWQTAGILSVIALDFTRKDAVFRTLTCGVLKSKIALRDKAYPFTFLMYSVGKQPIYFLKQVAKKEDELNPTMLLTSVTV